ncbi:MAG: hypothetical protein WC841_03365 [Candidatus Shapirobacteria bacterium]|jgi:hypothetical protein
MDRESIGEEIEKERRGPKIIGVIGPHRIGKDTVIDGLVSSLSGKDVRKFSIGEYIRDRLYETDDPAGAEVLFARELEEAKVESEDTRLNKLSGRQLVGEIKHNYDNRLPIPEEVADWIFKGFLESCSEDTIVLMSGGPYSVIDLKFMEKHSPPMGLILLAPTSRDWMEEIPRRAAFGERESMRDPEEEWNKWRGRVAEVMRHAYSMGYPVLHVNMRNPGLSIENVNSQIQGALGEFVEGVAEGRTLSKLKKIDIGGDERLGRN